MENPVPKNLGIEILDPVRACLRDAEAELPWQQKLKAPQGESNQAIFYSTMTSQDIKGVCLLLNGQMLYYCQCTVTYFPTLLSYIYDK